jgi:hypothetical protein
LSHGSGVTPAVSYRGLADARGADTAEQGNNSC